MKRIASALFLILLSFNLRADSDPALFFKTFESRIKRVVLENGLRLVMLKRDYSPTIACYIKFRSGSADETDESSGIAHMLEHMLFKGTQRIGTTDYAAEEKYILVMNRWARRLDQWKRVLETATTDAEKAEAQKQIAKWKERMDSFNRISRQFIVQDEGSYIYALNGETGYNAYTSNDLTNYQIQLPSSRMEVWARLESDRMTNSVLRDFYTERDVVAEERRMRVDNVGSSLLLEQFLARAYPDHPYGRPVIGPMHSIQFLNYEQALKFYQDHYAPNNTVISIVGDIDFEKTEALIRQYFGPLEARAQTRQPAVPTNLSPPFQLELKKPGSPVLYMGWFKPPLPDPVDVHMDVAARVLAHGRDSRLFKKLVIQDRIAAEIEIYNGYPGDRYTNMFFVQAVPAPGKSYDELQSAILREIENFRRGGITQEELIRARKNMEAEFIYSIRANSVLAERLSYFESMTGDFRTLFRSYELLESLTGESINESVRKYLVPENVMTARLLPAENGGQR